MGFALPTAALIDALGERLAPGVSGFADLFTDDAVLEVPFDGDGDVPPQVGRAAIVGVVESLRGVLTFEDFEITAVHDVDGSTVVYEAQGLLHRADLGRRFRRRYVSVVRLREGRIAHLREHGGPFVPARRPCRPPRASRSAPRPAHVGPRYVITPTCMPTAPRLMLAGGHTLYQAARAS